MAKINVISHRGANQVAPQNTLPAFKKLIENFKRGQYE